MIVNSPHDLATELNEYLKLGLTPRPWNLYSPADTFWWLVPSNEWPAYRYGKLAFSLAKDVPRRDLVGLNDPAIEPNKIFAGFNVEKGYGAVATVVNPALRRKPTQITDPLWLWFEVVGESGAARFSRTLAAAAASAELYLYVVSSYAHDRESNTQAQHDALMFRCDSIGITRVAHSYQVHVLSGAETATTFAALAERLGAINDYHWVDLYVGTHVAKGEVDLLALHGNTLSYFGAWLR